MISTDATDCFNYYQSLIGETISCISPDVLNYINVYEKQTSNIYKEASEEVSNEVTKVTLPLTDRNNIVPIRSGLNWGQRPEYNRNPNQAYIPVPVEVQRSGFFPERGEQFMVLTDDGKELICVRAQENGKGIHTTLNNSLMGEYFRYRLGLPSGVKVTVEDLLRYGRTNVDFSKIDEETYYLDFSVR